jgi:diguanylate cyclase (GGDEF)-like protein
MTTILQELDGDFKEPGETFEITEKFIPQIDEILDNESTGVLVVRLLSSGTKVYGYVAEGMDRLDDRSLQRNNEFSMFLSHSINTILHNMELRELNNHLSQAYGQIAALYVQDSMTGVLNRRGFYQALGDKIHQAENQGRFLHVYSIDMDGLKRINDTYGHSEGDFAINTMAHAIVSVGGENALCARFGGDEFVCAVISDMENESDADTFRRKLSCYIETVPEIKEKPYEIGASVGVCCERIFCRTQAEHMISRADKLMYQNKVQRKKQRVE